MSQNASQSARSSSTPESADPQKSKISAIEKSVTHLLIATKSLLETLTRWSKRQATETEVSDVYVKLGYEFNIACRAFKSVGVETADLGPVPDKLRSILEETLSGEPSQQYLDKYLPDIRDIIVNLLQGLKRKQQRLRATYPRTDRDGSGLVGNTETTASRQTSVSSTLSSLAGEERQGSRYRDGRHRGSGDTAGQDGAKGMHRSGSGLAQIAIPQRTSSGRVMQQSTTADEDRGRAVIDGPFISNSRPKDPETLKPPPYAREDYVPAHMSQDTLQPPNPEFDSPRSHARPGDALARLQRGGELERRASRRFSAYHLSKTLGSSTSGIPAMPPPQNSPIPNRGRDVREPMNAVRTRGSQLDRKGTSKYKVGSDGSPSHQSARSGTILEEASTPSSDAPTFELPVERSPERSPLVKTPDDKLGYPRVNGDDRAIDAAVRGGSSLHDSFGESVDRAQSSQTVHRQHVVRTPEPSSDAASNRSSQSKDLTLFLQYKTRVKKMILPEGFDELSIPRLQLAFIEKFAWNTHSNGVDLPEIYIQDPISGVRHELEDLNDIKNNCILVLNVDAIDEVKRHVDSSMGGLQSLLEDMKKVIGDQSISLKQVADQQQESSKDINRLTNQPAALPVGPTQVRGFAGKATSSSQLSEVQTLRRDLAVMRQSYTSWIGDVKKTIADVRVKADTVRDVAFQPQLQKASDAAPSVGRAYVLSSRKTLNSTSENVMTRVEELQDVVEELRKDVVSRGVRPRVRQLEDVSKEMSAVTREIKKMQDFVKKEKPGLQKIWREELQTVYNEQNELSYQEELIQDLEGDLEGTTETFKLVEEATKQQNLANGDAKGSGVGPASAPGTRIPSRTLNVSPAPDPHLAKDSVLGEVKALQPNHETRLEAIERAERNRRRELEEREGGEFKRELGNFVDEGKLKKSGGVEEAERIRKVKDERARQLNWERLNGTAVQASLENQPPDSGHEGTDTPNRELSTAMQDLSTLAGSGLQHDAGNAENESAAFAEAAKVPQPLQLDAPEALRPGLSRGNSKAFAEARESGTTTPEPQFVEASEELHSG